MTAWRLLDTGALPASINMAIDEALLQLHARGESPPTLRFYQWLPPAVSFGYFQRNNSLDLDSCRTMGLDIVRRHTGGRAVLHQNDLTYSVVAGTRDGIPLSLAASYRLLCDGLLAGCRLLGFEAERGRENVRSSRTDICFMRSAAGDLVVQGKKFMGSAQTWTGASLLQHGSLVLEPQHETWAKIIAPTGISHRALLEKLAARTTSLGEILGHTVEPDDVKTALRTGLAQVLGQEFEAGELTAPEWALARELASRHVDPNWPVAANICAVARYCS
ncbi:MAG: biotin/lipoate A/B protein ligase family protein [Deltaproteobacteria bacterium]|nr:biotin/lipoate A/B protein ligase family protein [Deltaproteobacteria bacterium]